jgi:hypothetical protein
MDLVLRLLGPTAVRLVDGLEGCEPLYWSGHDGFKLLVERADLDMPERLHYELAYGLASWWFRDLADPDLRTCAIRLLALELSYPPAAAPSAVMPTMRRCISDGDSVPSIRIQSA